MAKWWHTLLSIGGIVLTVSLPQIQGLLAAHPAITSAIAGGWAIVGHILPSPVAQK